MLFLSTIGFDSSGYVSWTRICKGAVYAASDIFAALAKADDSSSIGFIRFGCSIICGVAARGKGECCMGVCPV